MLIVCGERDAQSLDVKRQQVKEVEQIGLHRFYRLSLLGSLYATSTSCSAFETSTFVDGFNASTSPDSGSLGGGGR
jgi:hypothetical protein